MTICSHEMIANVFKLNKTFARYKYMYGAEQ